MSDQPASAYDAALHHAKLGAQKWRSRDESKDTLLGAINESNFHLRLADIYSRLAVVDAIKEHKDGR